MTVILDTTPRTRDSLLNMLKQRGPQTVRQLEETLTVSGMAVRQHLNGLKAEGLVTPGKSTGAVGRPALLWRLTEQAEARFPDTHGQLAAELLGDMRSLFGEDGMERLLARRSLRQVAHYRGLMAKARGLKAKLKALAEQRSREGYMAEVTENEEAGLLLVENHCPVCAAARACAGLCRHELDVFRKALGPGVEVERTDHIAAGARRCAYRVRKKRKS